MSVHAMDFHFYLRLLQILWPENTSSHISRHLDFKVHYITGSAGQLVSPGRWIPGSLGRWVTKCDPVPSLVDGQTDRRCTHGAVHEVDARCAEWQRSSRSTAASSVNVGRPMVDGGRSLINYRTDRPASSS